MTDLRVRPERPADIPAIRVVLAEAFALPPAGRGDPPTVEVPVDVVSADGPVEVAAPVEVALVEALRGGPAWLPELSIVAEADGAVVAYALLSRVTVGDAAVPALALGPVAVRPAYQGSGHGSAVVRAGLDAAAARGERLVLVLGYPAYYDRFGFGPAHSYGLTSPWSGPHYQALVIPGPGVGAAVPSGEVRYPAPWLDLD